MTRDPFFERSETFRANFKDHNLCVPSKQGRFGELNFATIFNFFLVFLGLENMWKD